MNAEDVETDAPEVRADPAGEGIHRRWILSKQKSTPGQRRFQLYGQLRFQDDAGASGGRKAPRSYEL
jgi:hypothetical protein